MQGPLEETPRTERAGLLEGAERGGYRYLAPIYADLRRLAGSLLRSEPKTGSLVATALANDAVVRLLRLNRIEVRSAEHLLSLAVGEMRRVLVDYARKRTADKRRGIRCELDERMLRDERLEEALLVERLLEQLREADERAYQITHMHFYGGLTFEEIGRVMGVSAASVQRDWQYAKVWLYERAASVRV